MRTRTADIMQGDQSYMAVFSGTYKKLLVQCTLLLLDKLRFTRNQKNTAPFFLVPLYIN